jgi:hypothetical protein
MEEKRNRPKRSIQMHGRGFPQQAFYYFLLEFRVYLYGIQDLVN